MGRSARRRVAPTRAEHVGRLRQPAQGRSHQRGPDRGAARRRAGARRHRLNRGPIGRQAGCSPSRHVQRCDTAPDRGLASCQDRAPDGPAHAIRVTATAAMPEQAAPRRRGPAAQELTYQRRVLRRIALGEPLDRTLAGLCRHVERLSPNANCTVLLLDRPAGVLRHGACPSLPRAYAELIDGLPVAEGAAACGTAAARGEVVIVEDILSDPLTAAFAEIGRQFGLASVWSQPLRQADGEVLGTVAVYHSERHRPSRSEMRAVANVGDLAALAIERSRVHAALQVAANNDSLTGLPNRARFLELVNERLRRRPRPARADLTGDRPLPTDRRHARPARRRADPARTGAAAARGRRRARAGVAARR